MYKRQVADIRADVNNFTLTKLTPGKDYHFLVAAFFTWKSMGPWFYAAPPEHYGSTVFHSRAIGAWSAEVSIRTADGLPGPPENLRAGSVSATSLSVAWGAPSKPNIFVNLAPRKEMKTGMLKGKNK